jgi:hypothetical protein
MVVHKRNEDKENAKINLLIIFSFSAALDIGNYLWADGNWSSELLKALAIFNLAVVVGWGPFWVLHLVFALAALYTVGRLWDVIAGTGEGRF